MRSTKSKGKVFTPFREFFKFRSEISRQSPLEVKPLTLRTKYNYSAGEKEGDDDFMASAFISTSNLTTTPVHL